MSEVKKENLTIPVYLDEHIVMDLIATIDDGFSEFYTIEFIYFLKKHSSI